MKIVVQFVAGLIFGMILGLGGLLTGAVIGGNVDFPAIGGYHPSGYEAGGVFFAVIGI